MLLYLSLNIKPSVKQQAIVFKGARVEFRYPTGAFGASAW